MRFAGKPSDDLASGTLSSMLIHPDLAGAGSGIKEYCVLSKDQASAVADQLIAVAESKRNKKALARLALRAGRPPTGVSTARFRALVDEAERHVATSWKLLCPVGAVIIIFVALYYGHAAQLMIGFIPCALLLLMSLRRRLVQSYILNAVRVGA